MAGVAKDLMRVFGGLAAAGLVMACGVAVGCGSETGGGDAAGGGSSADTASAPRDGESAGAGDRSRSEDVAGDSGEVGGGESALERLRAAAERKREAEAAARRAAMLAAQREREAVMAGPPSGRDGDQGRAVEARGDGYLALETTEVDFGRLYSDEPREVAFEFVNEGTGPLEITNIQSSCGCTVVDQDDVVGRSFQPGERGVIRAVYTPQGDGVASRMIRVSADAGAGARREATLYVKAEYVPPVSLSARYTNVGSVPAAEGAEAELFVDVRADEARIESVVFEQGARGMADGDVVPTGESGVFGASWEEVPATEEGYPTRLRVVFETVERPRVGSFNESALVTVGFTDPETGETVEEEARFRMVGSLRSVLELGATSQAQFIRIPTAVTGESFGLSEELRRSDGEPFAVESIETLRVFGIDEQELDVSFGEVEGSGGTVWEVTVSGVAPSEASRFGATVRLSTDIESEGPLEIRITGAARPATESRVSDAVGGAPGAR